MAVLVETFSFLFPLGYWLVPPTLRVGLSSSVNPSFTLRAMVNHSVEPYSITHNQVQKSQKAHLWMQEALVGVMCDLSWRVRCLAGDWRTVQSEICSVVGHLLNIQEALDLIPCTAKKINQQIEILIVLGKYWSKTWLLTLLFVKQKLKGCHYLGM